MATVTRLDNAMKPHTHAFDVRDVLQSFFYQTGVTSRFCFKGVDPLVSESFSAITRSWELGLSDKQYEKYATVGLLMATTAYRHTPSETQVAIAIYTFLGIMVDDDVMENQIIREFPSRLFDGRSQLHPILSRFAENLTDMRQHFLAYSANIITTNTVDFVNAEMLVRNEEGPKVHGPLASGYVDYIRLKNGLGETYAAFIWPSVMFPETKTYIQTFPHVAEFACLGNDLFSFYKEAKAGETENYVSQRAAASGQSAIETLDVVAQRLVALNTQIRAILGDGPERRAWESFVAGYAEFHLHTPRYLLHELFPEYY